MSVIAHAQHDETTFEMVLHPLTGIDHLLAIALVAVSLFLLVLALRGHKAATTAGTVTRVRSRTFVTLSGVLLATSSVMLVLL
jgi:hydrogenase/urease accessory protein HupE